MNMLDHSSYSTRNRSFQLKANLLAWYGKKLNLSQQKHALMNQKKSTTTQNKHKKTKARFSHVLQHPAWKQSRSILKERMSKGGDK